ncbi:MAG TPA: peptidylprolyl isomerase [Myxococcota bacterium]|nr:peptidylprolyl isomerase [Myxococcota bacterium]
MLKVLRQGQRWIMGTVILLVGGVFVFFIGVGKPLMRAEPHEAVVKVEGRQYSSQEVMHLRAQQEDQLRRSLGSGFDPKAMGDRLDAIAANTLAQMAIQASEAERLGLRVSDDELRQTIKDLPIFRDDEGNFSAERFKNFVEYEYGTERHFLQMLRDDLLAQKLGRLIAANAQVSKVEARDAVRQRLEQLELAIVALDTTHPPDGFEANPDQLKELLGKDEARVRAAYQQHPDRYHVPEQVRARHILFKLAKDAPPEQVDATEKKAEAARKQLLSGADFAALARELSDDPGSKEKGGDLGFFQRGQMVPAFDQAAFALEPGKISEPVRTDFGFHILRVEERHPAQDRTYDQVREELARELLAEDAGRVQARKDADELLEGIRKGRTLEDVAREMKLSIQRPGPMTRRSDGFVPGLGIAPELQAAAFAAPADEKSLPRVFELGNRLVLVEILERKEPSEDEVAKAIPGEIEQLTQEKRQRLQSAWIEARRKILMDEGQLQIDLAALSRGAAPRP